MHRIPLGPAARVSLPREGGVAYHAQESWILNDTILVRDISRGANQISSLTVL